MRFEHLQHWLQWQETFHPTAIDLGLGRVSQVFAALNHHRPQPLTITVAGTNGKGSCVAYLEAIYLAQGHRVGAYTSPHLLRYNERIKVNGQPVADAAICEAFARIEAVRGGVSLSYFEFGTLAALDIFHRSGLDVQVLEVGMGGRLDAVNMVDADAVIISSIGVDHVQWLGDTRELIGREKAGVFRGGVPAIIGDPDPPASLLDAAQATQARPYLIGRDFHYQRRPAGWDFIMAGGQRLSGLPDPNLKGEHQYRNAASALLAVSTLAPRLPVGAEAMRAGLRQAQLAGRFQRIVRPGKAQVLVDVGHNPEAVATLADHLRAVYPGRRVLAVFAMMRDKDIAGVLAIMRPQVSAWFFAPLANARALPASAMAEIFLQSGIADVCFSQLDFKGAFAAANHQAHADDLIVVFGSFFLVSECITHLAAEPSQ